MNHVIKMKKFSKNDLYELFNVALDIEKNPKKYSGILKGKIIGSLFFEPSTRTKLSFEAATITYKFLYRNYK